MSASDWAGYRIGPLPTSTWPRLKATIEWCRKLRWVARQEARSHVALPLAKRWRGWRHGFASRSYVLYDLDANPVGDYLSDYAIRFRTGRLHGRFNDPVRNKLALARVLALHGFRHCRVLGVLDRGRMHDLVGTRSPIPVRDWLAALRAGERVVLKPMAAGSAQGIIMLERASAGLAVNGIAVTLDRAMALLAPIAHFLITEFVVQAKYAAAIYPHTTNTVRVLTYRDPASGEPFVAAAAHRFGTARSAPVDNWHAGRGGLSARIDLEGGMLGPGATLSDDGRLRWHESHPESGAAIAGVRVDRWSETVATVLEATRRLPEAPVIGWDLVVTDDGPCFLEGNAPPGVFVWQVHGPLLADPRVRRFYETHEVI